MKERGRGDEGPELYRGVERGRGRGITRGTIYTHFAPTNTLSARVNPGKQRADKAQQSKVNYMHVPQLLRATNSYKHSYRGLDVVNEVTHVHVYTCRCCAKSVSACIELFHKQCIYADTTPV